MPPSDHSKISAFILQKTRAFPGITAGIARLSDLKTAPSYTFQPRAKKTRIASMKNLSADDISDESKSLLVLAFYHPGTGLHLDWWDGKGTRGNRILISIAETIQKWIQQNLGIPARVLPYHIENGGIFLKDAAVLAGIGVIGKNNLLVTPEFGPRVRLKALMLDIETGPFSPLKDFSPCNDCNMPCRRSCPQNAFAGGCYSKKECLIQMNNDQTIAAAAEAADAKEKGGSLVKFCRACEMICPKGNEE